MAAAAAAAADEAAATAAETDDEAGDPEEEPDDPPLFELPLLLPPELGVNCDALDEALVDPPSESFDPGADLR